MTYLEDLEVSWKKKKGAVLCDCEGDLKYIFIFHLNCLLHLKVFFFVSLKLCGWPQ